MGNKSELELLVSEIKDNLKQVSINKVDEVNVMKCMLNDPDFRLAVYDRANGYIGDKCPHDEAINFTKNIISGATGLDAKESKHLADNYEFTKRDANFLLDNMRDFIQVYSTTGRKLGIMQTKDTEASLISKRIPAGIKTVPDKDNPGQSKQIKTTAYTKLVSISKCPKYNV